MRLRLPAALVMLALIGAGCGSGSAANGDTGTTVDAGNPSKKKTAVRDEAVKFAECMRDNGVSEFPDPKGSGGLTIDGVVNGSSLDPDGPSWKRAIAACKDLQPPGFTGGGKRSSRQQSAGLEFAQCIRENRVKDFPDPVDGGPLVDTNRIPSANRPGGMTILNAAMQKCHARAEAAGARP
jgi:hypothetical protein